MRFPVVCFVLAVTLPCQAQTAILFGSDGGNQIGSIDRTTGAWTSIGSSNIGLYGLAYDSNHNVLYGCEFAGTSLYAVDESTGVATSVGSMGFGSHGLAFDPNTNTLYGVSSLGISTLNLGPAGPAGGGTFIPIIGNVSIEGLGFDPATSTLYGLNDSQYPANIVTLDTSTGVVTVLPNPLPSGSGAWRGLEWDSELGVLWATHTMNNIAQLYRVNPSTGVGTFVGTQPGYGDIVRGLAFKPGVAAYQLNQPGATLSINGIQGTSLNFAQVNLTAGQFALAALASTNQGQPWELAVGVAPLIPASMGALSTINGQLLNVNLADPNLTLHWGYFQSPPFSSFSVPVLFPFPGTLSIQMVVIAPGSPAGVALSQPVRVIVQ